MAMSSHPAPTLLFIPREIHDQIYLYLLRISERSCPSTTDEAGQRSNDPREKFGRNDLSYELHALPGIVPTLGLLGCCHQTRVEVQYLIAREDCLVISLSLNN